MLNYKLIKKESLNIFHKLFSRASFNLIISAPLIFVLIKSLRFNNSSTLISTISDYFNFEFNNNLFIYFIFNLISILSPFAVITLVEYYSNKKTNAKLSLNYLKNSGGGSYSDIWHFLFFLIEKEFPFILSLSTIGLAAFSNSLQTILNNIFSDLIISPKNQFSAIIIIFISFLIVDLISYTEHRMAHKIPFLWDMHELHHSATEMTIFSNFRVTSLENLFLSPLTVPLNVLIALTIIECTSKGYFWVITIYTIFNLIKVATMYLAHCSLKIIYPKPLSFFLMSPSLHWIHHSDDPKHYDTNFGMIFPFWDIIFNSYKGEKEIDKISKFGVKNSLYNKYNPFYSHYLLPINKLIKRLSFSSI